MRIIAGRFRGHRLKPLKGKGVRPTTDRVREAWMSAMGGQFDDLEVLDLFSGSGALGLEALSRGAHRVTFVEKARGALRVMEANISQLAVAESCTVVADDVFRFLDRELASFSFAVADPPYGSGHAQVLVDRWREAPFARELWLEHPLRETLCLPDAATTRRYGDTALTTLTAEA
jgi:16S rRNA (guanine966-N2)-methyltransferase